jgi:uncharacterized membrane protein YdjX (TVP38/TMEM64 family)
VDWEALQDRIERLDSVATIAVMALLPLVGFSISVVYLVAGAKFGVSGGLLVIAGVTAFHLLACHGIARTFLRRPMERLLKWRNHRLPEIPKGAEASLAVMAALVPGLPYFARNYLLALAGIPLRTYFWICLPLYVARSCLVLFLGDFGTNPSRKSLIILGSVYAVKLAVCAYLFARVRRRYRHLHPANAAKSKSR